MSSAPALSSPATPQVSVNYLAELLAGFLVPGKPLANIVSLLPL